MATDLKTLVELVKRHKQRHLYDLAAQGKVAGWQVKHLQAASADRSK